MGIFQKVRWTMHLTGHLGYFLLFAIHGYVLNLSVILAQVSLSSAFEVSENPGKTRAAKRTTYILSFHGLCSFMSPRKQTLRFTFPPLVFSSFINLYNPRLHDNLGLTKQRFYH